MCWWVSLLIIQSVTTCHNFHSSALTFVILSTYVSVFTLKVLATCWTLWAPESNTPPLSPSMAAILATYRKGPHFSPVGGGACRRRNFHVVWNLYAHKFGLSQHHPDEIHALVCGAWKCTSRSTRIERQLSVFLSETVPGSCFVPHSLEMYQ